MRSKDWSNTTKTKMAGITAYFSIITEC
jgi:hypothetical protein